jgi:hypothetical protein
MNYLLSFILILYSVFVIYSAIVKNNYYNQVLDLIPTHSLAFKNLIIVIITIFCLIFSYLFFIGGMDYKPNLIP